MDNQNFQETHKKVNLLDTNKKEESSNTSSKNERTYNKILNTNELYEKTRDSKKNNLIGQQCENNNYNYNLLNYYKDIDINFKGSKIKNNYKNFLPKKIFAGKSK